MMTEMEYSLLVRMFGLLLFIAYRIVPRSRQSQLEKDVEYLRAQEEFMRAYARERMVE